MNIFKLSWKNLFHNKLSLLLSLTLFALGVGLISLLLILNTQVQDKFDKNLAGIDLVIGAKGSPLQLILSSMYHIDNPTGNIPIKEIKPFMNPKHPLIETSVPISIGDSHKAFRIIGTTEEILAFYEGKVAQGNIWQKPMQVTIGAVVAERANLKLGDTFHSSHGLIEDDNLIHTDATPFKVVGILEGNGSVLDQLILTDTRSVWQVHDSHDHEEDAHSQEEEHDHEGHDHEGHDHSGHDHDDHAQETPAESKPLSEEVDQSITSLLVKFRGRNYQALNMQRSINENTNMQAATPAIELNRLYSLTGNVENLLRGIAAIIVIVSGISIFIALFNSLRERQYELALMRVMGASRGKLLWMILLEGLIIALLGFIIGMLLSRLGMGILSGYMEDAYRYSFSPWVFLKSEWYLLAGALTVGLLAAFIPAIKAARTDIHDTLTKD